MWVSRGRAFGGKDPSGKSEAISVSTHSQAGLDRKNGDYELNLALPDATFSRNANGVRAIYGSPAFAPTPLALGLTAC